MSTPLLPPIERDGITRAQIRICIRLVVLDHEKYPSIYSYPPRGILNLAERLRPEFPILYGVLVYISKASATGLSLKQIRHAPVQWAVRSIAKRRPVIAESGD